jgi:uncharacterized phage protein gp47/JayE
MADFTYVTTQGVIVPDISDSRTEVEQNWKSIYGDDLVVSPETPQGGIINTQVQMRDSVATNNAQLANQINPDIASGVFLDALFKLMGGERRPATRSVATSVVFGGVPNTLIPQGSLAVVSASGENFRTTSNLIIGANGTVTGDMESVNFGPVLAAIGALNAVGSSVLGWETITNPSAAVPGILEESDIAARARRRLTLAANTISMSAAIVSSLYLLPNVRSLSYRENNTDTVQIIDGITLAKHSIYLCIEGGINTQIAETLVREKTGGANYNGSVNASYTDPITGQTYAVKFDRPTEIQVFARITVEPSTLPVQILIPRIIQAYIAGQLEGEMGLRVGRPVSPYELSGVINQVEPSIVVRDVTLSTNGTTFTRDNVLIALNQVARLQESAIQVIIL